MIPHSSGHRNDLAGQIRDAMIAGEQVGAHLNDVSPSAGEETS